ncbi:MAG: glyoxylate/hydroxypyruvate reductase GhrA [Neisseriaceae bacterium]|nr:glyoxylate/hydroxypyruvate reductase GhrA [Neisseriaceae bacterium]
MKIMFYQQGAAAEAWLAGMQARLPEASIRVWQPGDQGAADYAMVWAPPYEMLAHRTELKGIMVLGAGVDAILRQAQQQPGALPEGVPIVRLEDNGMAQQMQEYALATALRYFRRLDDYQRLQQRGVWQPLPARVQADFVIGVMGAGVLGTAVAKALVVQGFPVRCWSRSVKDFAGVTSFAGDEGLSAFLHGTQMVINLLPNTPATVGVINAALLAQLNPGAYVVNLARGAHLVEADLLAALASGQVAGAALDVFAEEPLAPNHAFWQHSRVSMTPHTAAMTLPEQAMDAIAANIRALEAGQRPSGVVDRARGY